MKKINIETWFTATQKVAVKFVFFYFKIGEQVTILTKIAHIYIYRSRVWFPLSWTWVAAQDLADNDLVGTFLERPGYISQKEYSFFANDNHFTGTLPGSFFLGSQGLVCTSTQRTLPYSKYYDVAIFTTYATTLDPKAGLGLSPLSCGFLHPPLQSPYSRVFGRDFCDHFQSP